MKHLAENEINVGDRVRFHSGTNPGSWMEGVIVKGWHPDPNSKMTSNRVSLQVEATHGEWTRSKKGAPAVGEVRHPNPDQGGYFVRAEPVDPLDVVIDGISLGALLLVDESLRRDEGYTSRPQPSDWKPQRMTPAQRAAVSAHWSAQLHAKVAASAEHDRNRVLVDLDEP